MTCIFVNAKNDLKTLAKQISEYFEISFKEKATTFSLNETYYSISVFGIKIKLEENTYDYEDLFKYVIFIDENFVESVFYSKKVELLVSEIIIEYLKNHLKLIVAKEVEEELVYIQ